jgi:hypothetical protein
LTTSSGRSWLCFWLRVSIFWLNSSSF